MRYLLTLAVASIGSIGALFAQAPSQEWCEVAGVVVRVSDGQPLRAAVVTLAPSGRRGAPVSIRTDAGGRFSFSKVAPGAYRLAVERAGYTRQEYGQRQAGRRGVALNLTPGQRATDLLFRMLPAGVITGHVYDETGDPVVNANVFVLRRVYREGQPVLEPSEGVRSDDRGEYRLFNLLPGRYVISVAIGGLGAPRRGAESEEEAYVPTYYPGVTDPDRTVPLEIAAGQELTNIDLTLIPQSTVRVRGRVTGPAIRGGNTQVVLMPRSGRVAIRGRMRENRVEDDGNFELRSVSPGSYILAAIQYEENSQLWAREAIEVGNTDVEGIALALAPGGSVSGKVRVEGGALPEGRLFVNLRPDDGLARGGGARALPDGSFHVQNLAAGEYQFALGGIPADHYVKSIKLGNDEIVDRGLLVSRDITNVEIILSPSGGRVEGQVLTEENLPASGITVVLVPAKEERHLRARYRTVTTDATGNFAIRGIRPGEYSLFAWDIDEGEVWMDPSFLARYEDKAHKLRLTDATVHSARITLLADN